MGRLLGHLLGLFAVFVSVSGGKSAEDPTFCRRGFVVSGKYHDCWGQATSANKYPALYEPRDEYTPQFLEDYATHMCSVVKPEALQCLREEVTECSNADKIMSIADESGGACEGNNLSPFFKTHIIDHLNSTRSDSACFNIADNTYECYHKAGEVIRESGINNVDISHFHKVADRFFDYIWDCEIKFFKSNIDLCENWQIPMLITLQRMAMPSLFGMKLTREQVAKLELEPHKNLGDEEPPTPSPSSDNCTDDDNDKFFILVKLLPQRPEAADGDVVLQVDKPDGEEPQLSIVRGNQQEDQEITDFVSQIMDTDARLTLKEIRRRRKEERRKNKEIKDYISKIRDSQKKRIKLRKGKGDKGKELDDDVMID